MRCSLVSGLLGAAVIASCAGPSLLTARPAVAANLNFNFNNGEEGWTASPPSTNPLWEYHGGSSSVGGGWHGSVSSLEGTVAYLLSPCLEINQNNNQEYIHGDLSHEYAFPVSTQGQLQYMYSLGGVWQPGWHVIRNESAAGAHDGWVTDGDHDSPNVIAISPLVDVGNALAFSGTSAHQATGGHGNSGFFLRWADVAAGFGNGDEIMFRFALGITGDDAAGIPSETVWEINAMQFDGVQLCAAVPEIDPAGMGSVLVLVTGALGLLERRRLKVA